VHSVRPKGEKIEQKTVGYGFHFSNIYICNSNYL